MTTDIEQIQNVLSRYCRAVDERSFDELAMLFAEDCEVTHPAGTLNGRAALVAGMKASLWPAGRHMTVNVEVEVHHDEGRSMSDWIWLDPTLTPAHAGRYFDDFRRVNGLWLIHTRRVTFFDKQES